MKEIRWLQLMEALGFQSNQATYAQLVTSYGEGHRKYHNTDHLSAVLSTFDQASHFTENKDAIELALWFHDAVYKIFSKTNEIDSAVWAREFVVKNNAQKELGDLVYSHIMATEHNFVPQNSDARLLVDIDLAILGSSKSDYDKFEADIRNEYRLIPWFVYKKKRIEILSGFLNRERIYSHEYFNESLEERARLNMANAIHELQSA